MELVVQCMGPSRDVFGGTTVRVTLADDATVAHLLEGLAARSSEAADMVRTCAVAVGDEIVARTHALQPDDAVALLPPVAGGC